MARLLIGSVYFLRLDPPRWAEMQPFPPLGTLHAASYVRAQGHDVRFFDAMLAESPQEWAQAVSRERPNLAVLFDDNFNYLSKMCLANMRDAAFAMIAAARDAGAKVVVCSADAADHPELYLRAGADAVILGEGEAALAEIADGIDRDAMAALDGIDGIASVDAHGALHRGPKRAPMRDLDALPFPAWDLVDFDAYRRLWRERHGMFAVNMATTRGCPYLCNWCAKPIWGQSYTVRSAANVVAELKELVALASPDYIWFMDDIMGLKPKWWGAFADELERHDLELPFKCLSRADILLREGAIEDLKRAGCDIVWLGAESGSQSVLDAMDKGLTIAQIRDATLHLKDAGIRVGYFIQFGYPGENAEDIAKTLELIRENTPDELGISVSYPLPGTGFYERVKQELKEKRNWVDSGDLAMLYRGPFSTEFYRELHAYVHRDFKRRRAWRRFKDVLWGREPFKLRHLLALGYAGLTLPLVPLSLYRMRLLRARHPPQTPARADAPKRAVLARS
ncbi:MAG TPA: radical SAM protein [Micropepsaceae bacterium]|nr:radical SAM protein [Micropepsaceae bacterium]